MEPEEFLQDCREVHADLDALLEDAPAAAKSDVETATEALDAAMKRTREVHVDGE